MSGATDNTMRLLDGVIDPVLAPLHALPAGAHVVQLACGTGGLSLALARRRGDLRITAVDLDHEVLDAGRAAAGREGLAVGFRRMDLARLEMGDGTADGVISRMGLFLPGTAPFDVAAREAARILRPGGVLSLATWSDLADSPYTGVGLPLLRRILPEGRVPRLEAMFRARPEELEEHLRAAGLQHVEGRWYEWRAEYPDFDAWWRFGTGIGPLAALFGRLDHDELARARQMMSEDLEQYRTTDGAYRLPARARVVTAQAAGPARNRPGARPYSRRNAPLSANSVE
ncbi:class I SAM-dependent methyltransferase [Kineosporia succinea]|uniref:SAM-dependent methyltransferase n=1 Tax=Kineosporia succinea TaxID=84632 RepID=A0ABT9PBH9_9ACTN|nr:class I SAM-dependent methyltransferase [Kineosporia succinea]MDP9830064.1 SAM-dependent methyltransferase [Kineosporia succinea]